MASIQRKKGESFAEYKKRLAAANAEQKFKLSHGKMLWNSLAKGTYIKRKHGELVA